MKNMEKIQTKCVWKRQTKKERRQNIESLELDKLLEDGNKIIIVWNGAAWNTKNSFKEIYFPGINIR